MNTRSFGAGTARNGAGSPASGRSGPSVEPAGALGVAVMSSVDAKTAEMMDSQKSQPKAIHDT